MEAARLKQLLIIAGTGRNTGKTTLVCQIVRKFAPTKPLIAIKITPHFHKNVRSGKVLCNNDNLYIAEETDPSMGKDSSRMLKAGASHSFFVMAGDEQLEEAFLKIRELIPPGSLLICESGGMRSYVTPGLFFMMTSNETALLKPSAEKLMALADRVISFDGEKLDFNPDTIEIVDNQWSLKQ